MNNFVLNKHALPTQYEREPPKINSLVFIFC